MYVFQSNVVNAGGFSIPDIRAENALFQFLLSAGLTAPATRHATVCLNAAAKSAPLAHYSTAQKVKNMMIGNGVHLNSQVQNSGIHNLHVSIQLKSFKDALSS
ncbi:hypothetical protein HPP92_026265 [Vanilla planifolia]|uniref:Uncharacterized protein n=1 Tax=Vanilla planifolia TaxID=51239 RepID=A0A835PD12_VANPL|nr:hypothetical protein HPP92_026265 [Vanilla planifolia]